MNVPTSLPIVPTQKAKGRYTKMTENKGVQRFVPTVPTNFLFL
jgi:hypothetical protein